MPAPARVRGAALWARRSNGVSSGRAAFRAAHVGGAFNVRKRDMARAKRVAKKREKKNVPMGVAHIQASFNNTIVTFTDTRGNTVSWASAGQSGFKGSRKSTPFAAQVAAEQAARRAQDNGMRTVGVYVKAPDPGVKRPCARSTPPASRWRSFVTSRLFRTTAAARPSVAASDFSGGQAALAAALSACFTRRSGRRAAVAASARFRDARFRGCFRRAFRKKHFSRVMFFAADEDISPACLLCFRRIRAGLPCRPRGGESA